MHVVPMILAAALVAAEQGAAQPIERYLEVPATGEVGTEITAPGIEAALKFAAKHDEIRHIVFRIASGGGKVDDRDAIVQVLQDFDDRFVYHVVVGKAHSAAIVFVALADHVYFSSTGTSGAAVAYVRNFDSGDVEVDRKFNSADAARIAALAASKGHEGHIFRCMVVSEFEAHLHRDRKGEPIVLPHRDHSLEYVRLLDSDETILTLTPDEAVECGLGLLVDATPLAKLDTDESPWMDTGPAANRGRVEVLRAANRVESFRRRMAQAEREMERSVAAMNRAIESARDAREAALDEDPRRADIFYDPSTLTMTPGSRRAWVAATDRSLNAWRNVQSQLRAWSAARESLFNACAKLAFATREEREYRRVPPMEEDPCERVDLPNPPESLWEEADRAIARLSRERGKQRVDR